jgi:cation transport ATPase
LGRPDLLDANGISALPREQIAALAAAGRTVIGVAVAGQLAGLLVLEDEVGRRPER